MKKLSHTEAAVLLEEVLLDMFWEKKNSKHFHIHSLDIATTNLGEYNGLGGKKTNEIVLAAAVVAVQASKGEYFPLDTFWGTLDDLTSKNGGTI